MMGYRVYFNGEQYVMDDHKTVCGGYTDLEFWCVGTYEEVQKRVEHRNSELKQDVSELKEDEDFMIRTCKDCGEYFMLVKREVYWFLDRNLSIPCRCDKCRKKRKSK